MNDTKSSIIDCDLYFETIDINKSQPPKIDNFLTYIKNPSLKRKILLCVKNPYSVNGMTKILEEYDFTTIIHVTKFSQISSIAKNGIGIAHLDIESSFDDGKTLFISEYDLIAKKSEKLVKKRKKDAAKIANEVSKLRRGDLVVHTEYGLGVFVELKLFSYSNRNVEMIHLEYRGKEEIYLPIDHISHLKRYSSEQNYTPEELEKILDKLGSGSFAKKYKRAKKRIQDIAQKLVKTSAKRMLLEGVAFEKTKQIEDFYDSFDFIPTADQDNAIDDIEKDLASAKPMDRLICGDVGFGKTEVAMRAAALIVGGRMGVLDNPEYQSYYYGQVAIVVPTTILANQHYKNFSKRFRQTGVRIAEYTRNTTPKEKKAIKGKLATGEIDIIIGTHGILSSLKFKNLEMYIIDEEQHFGVNQKEALKKDRENIHCLMLSATPIPRTLNMSLSGVRDISLITTPPVDRLVTKGFVMEYDKNVIRNAVLREILRGGRVFYVCPRIADIPRRLRYLEEVVPEAKVIQAHGQMNANDLDNVMIDFFEGKYNVLVTTSIIESGIDISFANTIMIHKANMFGLSNLYQLKGRVGRGKTQAYSYFFVENDKMLTQTSIKRLKTISSIKSLGAGFSVATNDMDIRGAGNVIGDSQSGHIKDVGVEMYQEMVREAMENIQNDVGEEFEDKFIPEIRLGETVMIPDDYILDFNVRIEFYKKIGNCVDEDEFSDLLSQMKDRFGPIPDAVKNLTHLIKIKNKCIKYGIKKIDSGPKGVIITFAYTSAIDMLKLISHISARPNDFRLMPHDSLFMNSKTHSYYKNVTFFLDLVSNFYITSHPSN